MPGYESDCPIKDIPRRLHTAGRARCEHIENDDRLFMRHPPLPAGEPYGFEIPGHAHLEDQSANSDKLNTPSGLARDVLFDTARGNHFFGFQIACFDVTALRDLCIPNPNTVRKGRDGKVIQDADIYTFEVRHDPTPCMFPHCVIEARKNGQPPTKVSSGIKAAIRMKFADLAEHNRIEMLRRSAKEATVLGRALLAVECFFAKVWKRMNRWQAVTGFARRGMGSGDNS